MDVGPSAAPIIPNEAASTKSYPINEAIVIVAKIPNWAAAPNNNNLGLDNKGPKSIIAPIPINKSRGKASEEFIPTSNNQSIIPCTDPIPSNVWFKTPDIGIFTSIAPKPIGSNKDGSNSLAIAK